MAAFILALILTAKCVFEKHELQEAGNTTASNLCSSSHSNTDPISTQTYNCKNSTAKKRKAGNGTSCESQESVKKIRYEMIYDQKMKHFETLTDIVQKATRNNDDFDDVEILNRIIKTTCQANMLNTSKDCVGCESQKPRNLLVLRPFEYSDRVNIAPLPTQFPQDYRYSGIIEKDPVDFHAWIKVSASKAYSEIFNVEYIHCLCDETISEKDSHEKIISLLRSLDKSFTVSKWSPVLVNLHLLKMIEGVKKRFNAFSIDLAGRTEINDTDRTFLSSFKTVDWSRFNDDQVVDFYNFVDQISPEDSSGLQQAKKDFKNIDRNVFNHVFVYANKIIQIQTVRFILDTLFINDHAIYPSQILSIGDCCAVMFLINGLNEEQFEIGLVGAMERENLSHRVIKHVENNYRSLFQLLFCVYQ